MDQAAREIAESLMKMQSDFKRIIEDFETLGIHLRNAKGMHEKMQRGVDQFQTKLAQVDQVKALAVEKEVAKSLSEK